MKNKAKDLEKFSQDIVAKYLAGSSTYDIAEEFDTHPWYVNNILRENKIERRSRSQINHQRHKKDIMLSNALREKINGWLLGDGNLHFKGQQANFNFVSKHEEYIDYVIGKFQDEGIVCRKYHGVDKVYKTKHYRLATPSTLQFAELYHLWYKQNKKIVPDTLILSDQSIKHWIMDDGTLSKKYGHMRMCTCSFTIDECENLSFKLSNFIGTENSAWVIEKNKHPRIYIPKSKVKTLFSKIGYSPIKCFEYKFIN